MEGHITVSAYQRFCFLGRILCSITSYFCLVSGYYCIAISRVSGVSVFLPSAYNSAVLLSSIKIKRKRLDNATARYRQKGVVEVGELRLWGTKNISGEKFGQIP